MNRNNDVFQVLVAKDTAPVTAAGAPLENLLVGQIGAYDAKTNLSIASGSSATEFYLAVGVSNSGAAAGTASDDVRVSAAQSIQRGGINAYTMNNYTASTAMKVTLSGYTVAPVDTDLGLRLEFRNSRIYRIQGFNQYSKAYVVRTAPSPDGVITTLGANMAITSRFTNAINNDNLNLVVAQAIARTGVAAGATITAINAAGTAAGLGNLQGGAAAITAGSTVFNDNDLAILDAYNATAPATKVYSDVVLTAQPLKIGAWLGVNLGFHKLVDTVILPSIIAGIAGGTLTSTYPILSQGSYNNVMQKEYHASGWNGQPGPYRLSEVTGTAKTNFNYLAVVGTNYDIATVQYDNVSESGWRGHKNACSTIVAIPTGAAARTAIMTLLDGLITPAGYDAMVDDTAWTVAGDGSRTPNTAATDGIG